MQPPMRQARESPPPRLATASASPVAAPLEEPGRRRVGGGGGGWDDEELEVEGGRLRRFVLCRRSWEAKEKGTQMPVAVRREGDFLPEEAEDE